MNQQEQAMRPLAHLVLSLALVLCSAGVPAAESAAGEAVSLVELTTAPDTYDGKAVVVRGYLSIGFEKRSLCPSPQQAAGKDCVWLSGDTAAWRDLNGRRVTLRGIYDKQFLGHLGCCAGAVRATERPALAPDPAQASPVR